MNKILTMVYNIINGLLIYKCNFWNKDMKMKLMLKNNKIKLLF